MTPVQMATVILDMDPSDAAQVLTPEHLADKAFMRQLILNVQVCLTCWKMRWRTELTDEGCKICQGGGTKQ